MSPTNESIDKSLRLGRIAAELSTPEQILRAVEMQKRRPRPELEDAYVPANGPIEEHLAKIYAEALGLDHVGVKDNFFKLGGNSLMIVQIASRIREMWGVELPMQTFFQSPTIADLSINIIESRCMMIGEAESGSIMDMLDRLSEEEVENLLRNPESGKTDSPSLSDSDKLSINSHIQQVDENESRITVERYRCAALDTMPFGGNKYWIYSWGHSKFRIADSNTVEFLRGSRKFEKIENIVSGQRGYSDEAAEIREAKIKDLIDNGFLISESEMISSLTRISARSSAPLNISTVACVTCDRPDAAERALSSFILHCRSYERSPRFVVMDDSAELNCGNTYRQTLHSQKAKYESEIYYGGKKEKSQYIQQLVAKYSVPKDTLEYALFGLGEEGIASPGRNRNALLLETLDEGVFSLDDDTVCTVMVAPGHRSGLRLLSGDAASGLDPSEVWSLQDHEFAGKIPPPVDIDIIERHERYLGREVPDCLISAFGKEKLDIERAEADLPNRLQRHGGKIRITLNGLLGDCGWGSPFPYLLLEHDSFRRLTRSESLYQKILTSRELLRVTVNTVITDRTRNMMSTFLGYDNRDILPPFVPIGRGSDYIFALVLSKCYRDNFYAHLPYALIHSPLEKRSFWPGEVRRSAVGVDLASLLGAFINSFDFGDSYDGVEANLSRLGRFLEQLGALPEAEFAEVSRVAVCRQISSQITELEMRLNHQGESAEFWARDVGEYLSALCHSVTRPEIAVPLDLLYGHALDEALTLTQRAVREYGRLLVYWPAIIRSSRELKSQGHGLARVI